MRDFVDIVIEIGILSHVLYGQTFLRSSVSILSFSDSCLMEKVFKDPLGQITRCIMEQDRFSTSDPLIQFIGSPVTLSTIL